MQLFLKEQFTPDGVNLLNCLLPLGEYWRYSRMRETRAESSISNEVQMGATRHSVWFDECGFVNSLVGGQHAWCSSSLSMAVYCLFLSFPLFLYIQLLFYMFFCLMTRPPVREVTVQNYE